MVQTVFRTPCVPRTGVRQRHAHKPRLACCAEFCGAAGQLHGQDGSQRCCAPCVQSVCDNIPFSGVYDFNCGCEIFRTIFVLFVTFRQGQELRNDIDLSLLDRDAQVFASLGLYADLPCLCVCVWGGGYVTVVLFDDLSDPQAKNFGTRLLLHASGCCAWTLWRGVRGQTRRRRRRAHRRPAASVSRRCWPRATRVRWCLLWARAGTAWRSCRSRGRRSLLHAHSAAACRRLCGAGLTSPGASCLRCRRVCATTRYAGYSAVSSARCGCRRARRSRVRGRCGL